MSWAARGLPVLRVEAWHGLLVLVLFVTLAPLDVVEPLGLVLGAAFMGVNFLLLAYGIRWVITPFASQGRVRAGIFLLICKFFFLLAASWDFVDTDLPRQHLFRFGRHMSGDRHFY